MKQITKILSAIAAILAFIILVIFIFALQPDLSKRLGERLFPADKQSQTQPISSDTAGIQHGIEDPVTEVTDAETVEEKLGIIISLPQEEQYILPDEGQLIVPDSVVAKMGYVPVVETANEISEEESTTVLQELGYGETGEELTFDPIYYPYYAMLDPTLQQLYRQIYANAFVLHDKFAPVTEVSVQQVNTAFMAVAGDHPELFWLDMAYSCRYLGTGQCIEIQLQFNQTADNLVESKYLFEKYAAIMIQGAVNMASDNEKELYVHDMLISQVAYKLDAPMNQSAYSAIVNGQTVCAGYARAFQYLMQKLEVPCYYCTGYSGENHAWNIVKLENGYYNVDSTWNDTTPNTYDYFNKSDMEFNQNHIRKELSIYLPACLGEGYQSTVNQENSYPTETLPAEQLKEELVDQGRSLEDVGFTEADVLNNLDDYYQDAYEQIMKTGAGQSSFQNVILLSPVYEDMIAAYGNQTFLQEISNQIHQELGTNELQYAIEFEQLQNGYVLVTNSITVL